MPLKMGNGGVVRITREGVPWTLDNKHIFQHFFLKKSHALPIPSGVEYAANYVSFLHLGRWRGLTCALNNLDS